MRDTILLLPKRQNKRMAKNDTFACGGAGKLLAMFERRWHFGRLSESEICASATPVTYCDIYEQ